MCLYPNILTMRRTVQMELTNAKKKKKKKKKKMLKHTLSARQIHIHDD